MVDHEKEIRLELSNHELRRERLSTSSSEEIARGSAFGAGTLLGKLQSFVGNPAGTLNVAARLSGDRGTVGVELVTFATLFLSNGFLSFANGGANSTRTSSSSGYRSSNEATLVEGSIDRSSCFISCLPS